MYDSYFSLSEAYERLAQLRSKQEFENLSEAELEELEQINLMIQENSDHDLLDY